MEGYREDPKYNSCRELNRKKKYWAKPDKIYNSELKTDQPPVDDFKDGRKITIRTDIDDHLLWEKPNSKPLPPGMSLAPDPLDMMGVNIPSNRHTRFSEHLVIRS